MVKMVDHAVDGDEIEKGRGQRSPTQFSLHDEQCEKLERSKM